MKHCVLTILLTVLLASPAWAVGSVELNPIGEYLDAGVAANTAHASTLSLAIMVNLDTCSQGAIQTLIARMVSDSSSGYALGLNDSTCTLRLDSWGNDNVSGTATTAPSAGAWYGLGVTVNGSGAGAVVHFVRYTPSTGALATEDTVINWAATPSGTQKLTFGTAYQGSAQRRLVGFLSKAIIASGTVLTDSQMITWFCNSTVPTGTDGAWLMNESATPSVDSVNAYNATWTGTVAAGNATTACPSVSAKRRASGQ